jgi:glycosyltransferase involved in cell wall biosynthesis
MPLGFDLAPFTDDTDRTARRSTLRSRWSVGEQEVVITLIARLVPIKRVDRFLAVARALNDAASARFVIVGDGELHAHLAASEDAIALGKRLVWAGFLREVPDVCYASDVVMLTSDNEGTPVSLIEAQAAAVPVVATDVGGVRSVVRDHESGFVCEVDDVAALAGAVRTLLEDARLRARMADAGRRHVSALYTLDRLTADHAALYDELLAARRAALQAR